MAYNYYRKRNYQLSKTKAKNYANSMNELYNLFQQSPYNEWSLSKRMDSCYQYFDELNAQIRISNHSANNPYHNLYDNECLLINVKASKLAFAEIINQQIPLIIETLKSKDLSNYRFINIVSNNINCYLKNYKTKKEIFQLSII